MRFRGLHRSSATFQEVNSQQLAGIMFQKSNDFLERFLRDVSILGGIPFLKNITLYNVVFPWFLSQCFETVKVLVEAREKRLRIMRERLNLLYEFSQSLDPLVSKGKEVLIKGYSIYKEGERGRGRCTSDYLCSEALEPFWEVSKNRSSRCSGQYRENICEHSIESLEAFLLRIGYIFSEIKEADEDADANSLFGRSSGRLPFIEEELMVLRKLVDSITTQS